MAIIGSSNPVLNENTFRKFGDRVAGEATMTVQGTVNKTGVLFLLVTLAASYTWKMALGTEPGAAMGWVMGGAIGGFVLAMITTFTPRWSPITAPFYAVAEGFFLGGISAMFNRAYPGILVQAVGLTFGTLFCMLVLYKTGVIRVTRGFVAGVVAATGAICFVYLGTMLLSLFHVQVPFIHQGGIVGIGFSLFVVVIAALNLILDFNLIEEGTNQGMPKYMEWYSAFGLVVTLVWLYLEFLRLLAKLNDRR